MQSITRSRAPSRHREPHSLTRLGWLRAAVLGANDGLISTSSLMIGVATASANSSTMILTGLAGLVAGAMSMAAGEFVSVSSQADTEKAAIAQEKRELSDDFEHELHELTAIYSRRGLDYQLAREVASALMAHDALGAHTRDELGISEANAARPYLATIASACSFASGAALPLIVTLLVPSNGAVAWIVASSLLALIILGAAAARAGGANILRGAARVALWGAFAMAVSAGVGSTYGHLA